MYARHHPPPFLTAGASYYSPPDSGGPLACGGGALHWSTPGVANKTLPCGTRVEVCYRRCTIVRVIDRGPYVAGREFDLTYATARATGFLSAGVGTIRWRRIAHAQTSLHGEGT